LRLGAVSATVPLAVLTPGPPSDADGPSRGVTGAIYLYAAGPQEDGVDAVRGIFAFDPETRTWTKVADQSASTVWDTRFRVSRDGRFLALPRYPERANSPAPIGVSVIDLKQQGVVRKLCDLGGYAIWSAGGKTLMIDVAKRSVEGSCPLFETWLINSDGSELKKLPIPQTDAVTDWSTDGSWVVTCSCGEKGMGYQLYRMRLDGSEAHRLTTSGGEVNNLNARISPDGRRIAYYRLGDDQAGLWVMNADGSDPRRVFKQQGDRTPGDPVGAWSPDCRRIAAVVCERRRDAKGFPEEFNQQLLIVDTAGDAPLLVKRPRTGYLGPPQWTASLKP
jgi:hypothetical protein